MSLQQFQVVATEIVNPVAVEANIDCALATEKLDGTCCYVTLYKGEFLSEGQLVFEAAVCFIILCFRLFL